MTPPRYRTLDGDELDLPLAMDAWVVVPRGLARFDPELAWALDYDDAPPPDHADPRLDYSDGALLVPVDRWNEHAELEPNLAPCHTATPTAAPRRPAEWIAASGERLRVMRAERRASGTSVARAVRLLSAIAAMVLAVAYVAAVGAWLWSLRNGVSGPRVSSGLMLVGAAVLLAWLVGVTAAWRPGACAPPRRRSWPDLATAVARMADDPLGILRAGLALQLLGFVFFIAAR